MSRFTITCRTEKRLFGIENKREMDGDVLLGRITAELL
jgi:hypothetical protein